MLDGVNSSICSTNLNKVEVCTVLPLNTVVWENFVVVVFFCYLYILKCKSLLVCVYVRLHTFRCVSV